MEGTIKDKRGTIKLVSYFASKKPPSIITTESRTNKLIRVYDFTLIAEEADFNPNELKVFIIEPILKRNVPLCSMPCFFIMWSMLTDLKSK